MRTIKPYSSAIQMAQRSRVMLRGSAQLKRNYDSRRSGFRLRQRGTFLLLQFIFRHAER